MDIIEKRTKNRLKQTRYRDRKRGENWVRLDIWCPPEAREYLKDKAKLNGYSVGFMLKVSLYHLDRMIQEEAKVTDSCLI